jgi:hypothetical protein
MNNNTAFKKFIAAASQDAAQILGTGINRPCDQERVNNAIAAALADPKANLSPDDREKISRYLMPDQNTKSHMIHVRVSPEEREQIIYEAEQAGLSMTEYLRRKIFGK